MDLDTIYSKTGKGTRALSAKAKDLPKGALKVLPLIDSKTSAGEILNKLDKFTEVDLQILLTQLESGGYIRVLQATDWEDTAPAPGSSAIVVEELSTEDFLRSTEEPDNHGLPDLQPAAEETADDARLQEAQRIYQEFAERLATETQKQSEQIKAEEAQRKARDEANRIAAEQKREAEKQAQQAAESAAALEAERAARAEEARHAEIARLLFETEQAARVEQERIVREKAEREAKLAEESRRRIEAEAKLAAERLALLEAKRQAREEKEARKQAEAERKAFEAAEKKARKEEEERLKAAAKEQARIEKATRDAEEKHAREEAERKLREEAEVRRQAEDERKAREEAEHQARLQEAARLKAEADARAESEKQARLAEEAREREEAERLAAIQRAAEQKAAQEREAQQEAARIARELEAEQRKAVAEEARRQAKEEAQREAEERALRKQEQKQQAQAERLAKKLATREAARASRQPGRFASAIKTAVLALPLTLIALVAALHFINLAPFGGAIARTASESLGEPVRFATLHAALLPQPELRMGEVRIGENEAVQIASVRAEFALSTLFDDIRRINRLTLEDAAIAMNDMDRMQRWFTAANTSRHVTIARVDGKNIAFHVPGLTLPPLNANVELANDGSIVNTQLESVERTLSIALTPQEQSWKFTLDAHAWQPPLPTRLKFDELHAEGVVRGNKAHASIVEGSIYAGKFKGESMVAWNAQPQITGHVTVENIRVEQALATGKNPAIDGSMSGDIAFTSVAPNASALPESAVITARFAIAEGMLYGIDLSSSMLPANRERTTRFDRLTGNVQSTGDISRFRQLVLKSSQLDARGEVEIRENGEIDGKVTAELLIPSRRMQANFGLGGTVGDVRIR